MSPPITTNDFLELVEKSGLFESAMLARYREALKAGGGAIRTPGDIARKMIADGWLTSFQARRLASGRYRGFFIADKYKILEPIGEGGMGRVFLCEQLLLRRLVAVKIMTVSTKDYPGAIERFVREARATASLDHRNIARVFDVEQTTVGPCMVMEYVNGTSLQEIVYRHGPLGIDRAAHYIAQAAAGLEHAHQANLVHRDIKPENILLDSTGTIKLLDLGLARFCLTEHNDNLTQRFDDQAVMGTANYIAPEQVANSSQVDIRADIYSLGCTFYYLLAGKPPFDSGTPAEKMLFHQGKNPRSILEIRPEAPKALAAVLNKMLSKRPADRFQTPSQVAAALAAWTEKAIDQPRAEEVQKLNPSSFKLGLSPLPRIGSGKSAASASTPHPSAQSDTHRKSDVRLVPPPLPARMPIRRLARWQLGAVAVLALCALVASTWGVPKFLASGGGVPAIIGRQTAPDAPSQPTGDASRAGLLPAAVTPTGVVLRSGGSSFVAPLMEHWAPLYEQQSGTKIDYTSLGSSSGVEGVVNHFLDFGCTESFLSDEQLEAAKGRVVHIPLVLGAVVPTYNVNDVGGQPLKLRFTGPLLASIYLGLVKKWNDPTIAVNNPGKTLPDLDIHVVHRSDGSGTTAVWTDYLSKVSAEWKSLVGVGNRVDWPIGEGAEKNDGVADAVSRIAGAVGYVEFSYALANGLKVGQVKNKSGIFVEPSVDSVTAAAAGSMQEIPADLRYSLTDAPGKSSYPIAGTCWAVAFIDQPPEKRAELIKFFHWATHDGQHHVRDLRYAPLPAKLMSRVEEAIKRFEADGAR